MLIYYFYLYYWFFDLDNFFILYFASDGTGSVPFVAGGEIGKFSQYQLNIYLFLLGLLLDNFNDKKFIFDLCSLVIFWTFVFALVKPLRLFNNNSLKTLFGLTVVGALLTYAPFGHWFFVETATPSKLAEILFICSLIIFSPVKKYKALFLIIVTLLAAILMQALYPLCFVFLFLLDNFIPLWTNRQKRTTIGYLYNNCFNVLWLLYYIFMKAAFTKIAFL